MSCLYCITLHNTKRQISGHVPFEVLNAYDLNNECIDNNISPRFSITKQIARNCQLLSHSL